MDPACVVRPDVVFDHCVDPGQFQPDRAWTAQVDVRQCAIVLRHVFELAEVHVVAGLLRVEREVPFGRSAFGVGVSDAKGTVATVRHTRGLLGKVREGERIIQREIDDDQGGLVREQEGEGGSRTEAAPLRSVDQFFRSRAAHRE